MRRSRILLAATLASLTGACGLTESENERLETWLRCDDCLGLRAGVSDLSYRAIPRLGGAVIGPPPHGVENVRLQVSLVYERLRLTGQPPLSLDRLVEHSLGGYVGQYQKHAAISLGDIARKEGLACALQRCRQRALGELRAAFAFDSLMREHRGGDGHYRTDVLDVIREQIESLGDTAALPDLGILIQSTLPAVIYPGDTFQLVARVIDVGGRDLPLPIVWSSSNSAVATVDSDGTLVAVGPGTARITAAAGPHSVAIDVSIAPEIPV